MTTHTPQTYRKKPATVTAFQWDALDGAMPHIGLKMDEGSEPCPKCNRPMYSHGLILTLETKQGTSGHSVCPGDYIIKGVAGEYYACKPDIFHATYDLVEDGEG